MIEKTIVCHRTEEQSRIKKFSKILFNYFLEETCHSKKDGGELHHLFRIIEVLKTPELEGRRVVVDSWRTFEAELNATSFEFQPYLEKEKLCREIKKWAKKFLSNEENCIVSKVITCEFTLIKRLYPAPLLRLEKLQHLSVWIQDVAMTETGRLVIAENIFMDDILEEMLAVRDTDVPIETKTKIIACYSIAYGFCYTAIGSCKKAIEILEKAIFMLQFVFGKEHRDIGLLSVCYHNIGVCNQKLLKFASSKQAIAKATKTKKEENKRSHKEAIPILSNPDLLNSRASKSHQSNKKQSHKCILQ